MPSPISKSDAQKDASIYSSIGCIAFPDCALPELCTDSNLKKLRYNLVREEKRLTHSTLPSLN